MTAADKPTESQWWRYVRSQLDLKGWKEVDLARAMGKPASTIGAWKKDGAMPRWDVLREVSDALGRPYAEVLVATGLTTAAELGQLEAEEWNPSRLSTTELIAAQRRLTDAIQSRLGVSTSDVDTALDAVADDGDDSDADVTPISRNGRTAAPARRKNRTKDGVEDVELRGGGRD